MRTTLALVGCFLLPLSAYGEDELSGTRGKMSELRHTVRITIDRGHARMVFPIPDRG